MVEDGQYSSKSRHRFLKEEEAGPSLDSLEPPTDSARHFWGNIWSLDVPNKVKHFTWRTCENSLPTKCNLVRHRVVSDYHCDRCTSSPEHMLHALGTCSEPDVVWEAAEWNFRSRIEVQNFSELLAWIFENRNSAALFCVTAWSIWQQRNQIRNHQNHHSTRHLARAAADWLAEFSAVQPSPTPRVAASRQTNWMAPPPNVYKINYGGAFSLSSNCSGIGVVIQNNAGLVVASLAQRFCQAYKPVEIEAMAATKGHLIC